MLRSIAGLLAGLFVSACFAQDDGIVVTATRFADSKRNLPVGVTVITADDIRQSATSNLPGGSATAVARFSNSSTAVLFVLLKKGAWWQVSNYVVECGRSIAGRDLRN